MRTSALAVLLLPALVAGCLGGEPAPPVPTGQIDGAVVDHLLRPFGNETVFLSQLGRTDQTSPLGGFTFREVPVGSYTLLAAHEGTQGTAVVVDVSEDHITKVILQLMPTPVQEPRMLMVQPNSGFENMTFGNGECTSCAWTVALDAPERPAEVIFEFRWESSLLGDDGDDAMTFEVMDDRGDLLRRVKVLESPATVTIHGDDIPADATELRVQAWFGSSFTPRANFHFQSYATFYYGATSDEMFSR